MRWLRGGQPQLKRELFAMKLYARTGRTLRSASVRLRAVLPISGHRRAALGLASCARPIVYISNQEARNCSRADNPRKEGRLAGDAAPFSQQNGALMR
jgi:hypothetical protein